jgi:hypothetical protein
MPKLDKSLLERWTTPEGQRLVAEVVKKLQLGESLNPLDLDEHEGRVDLRGMPIPKPTILGTDRVMG